MSAEQSDLSTASAPSDVPSLLQRWRKRVAYQGASLSLICALVALILLLADALTAGYIATREQEDQLFMLHQVLPGRLYDNNPPAEAFTVQDAELGAVEIYPARLAGELTAVAFRVSNNGYGGPIVQLVALDTQGNVLGVRVLSHKETPGLGDKIEAARSAWITGFDGLSLASVPLKEWAVKKDGGRFDQFSGATITPRAVVKSVLEALQFHARHMSQFAEGGSAAGHQETGS